MYIKKIIVIILVAFFAFNTHLCFAQTQNPDYSSITNDVQLVNVIKFIKETPQKYILDAIMGNNSSGKPIKLAFRDLSLMNYSYRNYDALTCMDKNGNLYILIANKHKDAPVEALATLLAHETIHDDNTSSIEEEIHAWTNEAQTWIEMKKANTALSSINDNDYPLVKRLNYIEKLYRESHNTSANIEMEVVSNSAYKNLALYSPGYGI